MAELFDIIERDYQSTSDLGNTLSLAEILGTLAQNGITGFTRNARFSIRDSQAKVFVVVYIRETDTYYYERLTKAI